MRRLLAARVGSAVTNIYRPTMSLKLSRLARASLWLKRAAAADDAADAVVAARWLTRVQYEYDRRRANTCLIPRCGVAPLFRARVSIRSVCRVVEVIAHERASRIRIATLRRKLG